MNYSLLLKVKKAGKKKRENKYKLEEVNLSWEKREKKEKWENTKGKKWKKVEAKKIEDMNYKLLFKAK